VDFFFAQNKYKRMAKKENNLFLGISESLVVEEFMQQLDHPLSEVAIYLRSLILKIDAKNIGEGIFWNAPTFYFLGALPVFDPKEYKRYLAGFVFNKKESIRLVLLHGGNLNDPDNLLEGDYTDGRRLITFTSVKDAQNKEAAFTKIIEELIKKTPN
jgi:hypothetical protein